MRKELLLHWKTWHYLPRLYDWGMQSRLGEWAATGVSEWQGEDMLKFKCSLNSEEKTVITAPARIAYFITGTVFRALRALWSVFLLAAAEGGLHTLQRRKTKTTKTKRCYPRLWFLTDGAQLEALWAGLWSHSSSLLAMGRYNLSLKQRT